MKFEQEQSSPRQFEAPYDDSYGGTGRTFEHDVWGKALHIPEWNYKQAVEASKRKDYMLLNRMYADALIASDMVSGDQKEVVRHLERMDNDERTQLFIDLAKKHQLWNAEDPGARGGHSIAKKMMEMLDMYIVEHGQDVGVADEKLYCYNLTGSPADIRGSDGCFEIGGVFVTVDTTLREDKDRSGADVIVRNIVNQAGNVDESKLEPYIQKMGDVLIERLRSRVAA